MKIWIHKDEGSHKININDDVYFIYNNEIKHSIVLEIKVEKNNNINKIKYKFKLNNDYIWLNKHRVFKNKEELLKHINEFV